MRGASACQTLAVINVLLTPLASARAADITVTPSHDAPSGLASQPPEAPGAGGAPPGPPYFCTNRSKKFTTREKVVKI
jgi:hypothetical protein